MSTDVQSHPRGIPAYRRLLENLQAEIRSGRYKVGDRLPSEHDLCELHGVSRITVTKALGILTREGWVIRKVGNGTFAANPAAGADASPGARTVGVVLPRVVGDSFYTELVHGVETELARHDLTMALGFSGGNAESEWRCMQRMAGQHVAGLILFMADLEASWRNVARFRASRIPLALIDHRVPLLDDDFETVVSDSLRGGFLATEHLIRLGHRRIGLLSVPVKFSSVLEREEGYRLALAQNGLPYDPGLVVTIEREPDPAGEYPAILGLLSLPTPPTAVFAVNDATAVHTLQSVLKRGYRVPEDLAIVGFDDNDIAALAPVPLTTIRQDKALMGRRAAERIVARYRNPAALPEHVHLDVELVARESSGAVRSMPYQRAFVPGSQSDRGVLQPPARLRSG